MTARRGSKCVACPLLSCSVNWRSLRPNMKVTVKAKTVKVKKRASYDTADV